MQQSACLVINSITVDNFDALFNCKLVGRALNFKMIPTYSYSFLLVGTGAFSSVAWSIGAQPMIFCIRFPVLLFGSPGISI